MVEGFYVPCLKESALYRRAVGYFSSAGLAHAAQGVASLIARRGKMRLIASPHLEEEDLAALERAKDDPGSVLAQVIRRSLKEVEDLLVRDRLNALAWLVADGALEVRLALRVTDDGRFGRGLYHEKIGIFTDEQENHVAFAGSSNETQGGLIDNFESIKVFWSWDDPHHRVEEEIRNFEALWEDRTSGVRVLEFTEVAREVLERFRLSRSPVAEETPTDYRVPPRKVSPGTMPEELDLREYQKEAIRAWSKKGGRGIFAMATGSGKTITALTLASKVLEKNDALIVIVVCPFLNLCRQWVREMANFGIAPVQCYENKQRWIEKFEHGYQEVAAGVSKLHAIVTTNATFRGQEFQSRLRAHLGGRQTPHLLIADEVHNLGADRAGDALPSEIRLRLGLSATPERHLDPEGTAAILDYFGDIIYEYGIDQAIAEGRLCRYRYHPVLVTLNDEEAQEYSELTEKLARLIAGDDADAEIKQTAMHLLIKRARLLGAAANKIPILARLVASLPEKPTKAIFYCGDGRTTDSISQADRRQIEAVARMLGDQHGLRVRNFTYEESPEEREAILRDLGNGFLDGVVAIRCLDEGIDLPDLRMGFLLASSTNPRQFVQRRGRLLRKAEGKRFAEIYDFIIEPPDLAAGTEDAAFNLERSMFARELKRISEFCRTAENGPEAAEVIRDLCLKYNLISY